MLPNPKGGVTGAKRMGTRGVPLSLAFSASPITQSRFTEALDHMTSTHLAASNSSSIFSRYDSPSGVSRSHQTDQPTRSNRETSAETLRRSSDAKLTKMSAIPALQLPNSTPYWVDVDQRHAPAYRVSHHVGGAALALRGFAIPHSQYDVGQIDNPLACCQVCVLIRPGRVEHFDGRLLDQLTISRHMLGRERPLDIGKWQHCV